MKPAFVKCVLLLSMVTFCQLATASTFVDSVSQDAKRIRIPVEANVGRDYGYYSSDSPVLPALVPGEISTRFPGTSLYWPLGNHLGSEYCVAGELLTGLQFLAERNRNSYQLRLLKRTAAGDLAEVTSGILSNSGNNFEVPVEVDLGGVGQNRLKSAIGGLTLRLSDHNNQPAIYANSRLKVDVSGSTLLERSKLIVTVSNLTSSSLNKSQGITLRIEPFDTAIPPRSVSGKLSDVLDLMGAKVVVERAADDLSEITLAVVNGEVGQAESYQAKLVSTLPPVAQVELFTRRLITGNDLIASASKSSGILMIFGDFKEELNPGYIPYPGSGAKSSTLQMSEAGIMETIRNSSTASATPQVVFVVRQVSLKKLYDDYLGKQPPFLVISNFADPLRVTYRSVGREGGPMYYPGNSQGDQPQKSTLRDSMGLPENRVSVLLLDRSGKVIYSKADAGEDLRTPIVEAARMLESKR